MSAPYVPPKKQPWKKPIMAGMMQSPIRNMMGKMMTFPVSGTPPDCNYKEAQDFMVPAKFDPAKTGEGSHDFPNFVRQRPYLEPGYVSKAPKPEDIVPDGKIESLDPEGMPSTLLTEAKKVAAEANSKLVVIAFESITCPFWRMFCGADLEKVSAKAGVPTLHIVIREAHPKDEFHEAMPNEGLGSGMPMGLKRVPEKHKTIEDRRKSAEEAYAIVKKFHKSKKLPIHMWLDTIDDNLEATYEARPWRSYVIEAETGKMVDAIGLTPFCMKGKIQTMKNALASK